MYEANNEAMKPTMKLIISDSVRIFFINLEFEFLFLDFVILLPLSATCDPVMLFIFRFYNFRAIISYL